MKTMLSGYVHSLESGAAADGPGIRFVVFLSGCPLRCLYCHNPDCQDISNGKLMSVADIVGEISPKRQFMKRSGGGVTISGGEPLLQGEFVAELLRACKSLGLHTALDTSGFQGSFELSLDDVDLVLLDLKSSLPEVHRQVTGVEQMPTYRFAQRLRELGKPTWLRFVLVPGLTDQEDNIRGVAEFAASMPSLRRVEILPFHKMGEEKWRRMGKPYQLSDTPAASSEDLRRARGIFAESGIQAY